MSPFRLALPVIAAFTGVPARAETTGELGFTNDTIALTRRHYPNAKITSQKPLEIISRPLADNLVLVLAVDLPKTLVWATVRDYPGNRARHDRLIAIALANTSQDLAAGVADCSISVGRFTLVAGNAYDSSCIADHARWTVSAQAAKGRFLVAIPGADACLFGDVVTAGELAEFRSMSRNISDRAERAVSDQVYQWTPEGWTKVP